jgi:hypothetical protein
LPSSSGTAIGRRNCKELKERGCLLQEFNTLNYKNLKIKIYRIIILPVVLYGYETWSLTLREERRLRVSENRVLRTVFGPKRDEMTGEWRKLHNEELNDLYSLNREEEMGGACGAYGGGERGA